MAIRLKANIQAVRFSGVGAVGHLVMTEVIYAKIAAVSITSNANAKSILLTQIVNNLQLNQGTLG